MPQPEPTEPLFICDLTQSYAPHGGGGISTYLREKRDYLRENTPHRHIQIVPGPETKVVEDGRHVWVEIEAPPVPESENYRFILKTKPVHEVLAKYRPDIIESLCPWLLPWTAINHRKTYPETALVAGYRTDFPNAHVYRVGREKLGERLARGARWLTYGYAEMTYREFDWVYTLGEANKATLDRCNIERTSILPLGVDTTLFHPNKADPGYAAELGLDGDGPLLVYAGRIDNEKRANRVTEMMEELDPSLGAKLVMLGHGKLKDELEARMKALGLQVAFPGFVQEREDMARALASADLYVSGMADETFGISIIEAQAAGLPVIGVASGAMPARVPEGAGIGYLGPVDDPPAMARLVEKAWAEDTPAMSARARAHVVERYGWDRTFERLLEEIYPRALAFAKARQGLPRRRWPEVSDLPALTAAA